MKNRNRILTAGAKKLRSWRSRTGTSQQALAKLVGGLLDFVSISKYERGVMRPSTSTAQRIQAVTDGRVRVEDWAA
jgi:transcriptional regulator with XRE-family HTH domain